MTVYVITMVPSLLPKNQFDLSASRVVQVIRENLKKNGGEPVLPILKGDATMYESIALEPLLGPFDAVVTRHHSIAAYNKAIGTQEYKMITRGKNVLTFGFHNNFMYVDFLLPALRQVFSVIGEKIDIRSKMYVEAGGRVDYSLYQVTGDRGLQSYKRRINLHPNRSFYLIELRTKIDTPEGRANDLEHTRGWQKSMFSTEVEVMYAGKIVSLDRGPKMFREVAIYKFPNRELFVEMMESDHYSELAQLEERFVLDRFVELCLPVY
jgi:hypothetical protein